MNQVHVHFKTTEKYTKDFKISATDEPGIWGEKQFIKLLQDVCKTQKTIEEGKELGPFLIHLVVGDIVVHLVPKTEKPASVPFAEVCVKPWVPPGKSGAKAKNGCVVMCYRTATDEDLDYFTKIGSNVTEDLRNIKKNPHSANREPNILSLLYIEKDEMGQRKLEVEADKLELEVLKIFTMVAKLYVMSCASRQQLVCPYERKDTQNIVATAEATETVFMLTEAGIAMAKNRGTKIDRWYRIKMTGDSGDGVIKNPVFMKVNCNGTCLLIATKYEFYIIENGMNSDSLFIEANMIDMNNGNFLKNHDKDIQLGRLKEIQFFWKDPDYCIIAYEKHIMICNIRKREEIALFDVSADMDSGDEMISVKYHFPDHTQKSKTMGYPATIKSLDHAMMYLTAKGKLGLFFAQDDVKDGIPEYSEERKSVLTLAWQNNTLNEKYVSFDSIGDYMIFGTENGHAVWTEYKQTETKLSVYELKKMASEEGNNNDDYLAAGGNITISRYGPYIVGLHLYGVFAVFANPNMKVQGFTYGNKENLENRAPGMCPLLYSVGIIGCGCCNSMLTCIRSPGYIVTLPGTLNGVMRVDPEYLWEDVVGPEKPMVKDTINAMNKKMPRAKGNAVQSAESSDHASTENKNEKAGTEGEIMSNEELDKLVEESGERVKDFDAWATPNDELIKKKLEELKKMLEALK